jgi:steroid 5-alpha reductase family enzyme
MIHDLLFTLALSLGIQAVFFAFAAAFRTDKVTDLSYGLTFFVLAAVLLAHGDTSWGPQLALAGMVMLWALRLAGYLLYRIMRIKRDPRFDGIRERFWKFFQFWFFQGLIVWVIMLPTILWFSLPEAGGGTWTRWMVAGAATWLVGLVIETLADVQKFRYKSREGKAARWMSIGLWRYSRHPNYFGELLCWWGLFVFVLPGLGWWALLGLAGPLAITYVLLAVTGIPTLEKSANEKWGADAEYQQYRRDTNKLVPWPRRY